GLIAREPRRPYRNPAAGRGGEVDSAAMLAAGGRAIIGLALTISPAVDPVRATADQQPGMRRWRKTPTQTCCCASLFRAPWAVTPSRQLLLTRSERRFCFSMLASSSTRSACARLPALLCCVEPPLRRPASWRQRCAFQPSRQPRVCAARLWCALRPLVALPR